MKIIDFADDLRMADLLGTRDELAVVMAKFKDLSSRLGAFFREREGKRWWLTRIIPWLRFMADTNEGVVRLEKRSEAEGMALRQGIFGLQADSTLSARGLPSAVFFFSFRRGVAPGGFCQLHHGWNVVDDSGIMEAWRSGEGRAELQVPITGELRSDVAWRHKAL